MKIVLSIFRSRNAYCHRTQECLPAKTFCYFQVVHIDRDCRPRYLDHNQQRDHNAFGVLHTRLEIFSDGDFLGCEQLDERTFSDTCHAHQSDYSVVWPVENGQTIFANLLNTYEISGSLAMAVSLRSG